MCMYIDQSKVDETLDFCHDILHHDRLTLHQLESLIGRLIYVSKLATPARQFMNRILSHRRSVTDTRPGALPEGVRDDIRWFCRFLPVYNGFALIRPRLVHSRQVFTDACLVGGGGFCPPHCFFRLAWPPLMSEWSLPINQLECFTLLIAIRAWADRLSGHTVKFWCDNEPTVLAFKSGKSQNLFTAACLREFSLLAASHDITPIFHHIEGKANITADILSRAEVSEKDQANYRRFLSDTSMECTDIAPLLLDFPDSTTTW